MSEVSRLKDLPDISFIDGITLSDVMQKMKNWYETKHEELTGEKISLADSDPEMLKLGACALLIYQCMEYIDFAGKMNLIKYSEGDFLENLVAGMHVTRKEGQRAQVTIRFLLSAEQQESIIIQAGTRCVTEDDIYFETMDDAVILPGETMIDVACQCTASGTDGNGYLPGEIDELVDTVPYVDSISNITESSGGSDNELDEDLAERYFLSFLSLAPWGGSPYYERQLRTWRSDVGDVICVSPKPCYTDVFFLMDDSSVPDDTLISAAQTYLSAVLRRELGDVITVKKPAEIDYEISLTYYIAESDRKNADAIQEAVTEAVNDYKMWQSQKMGRDINPSMLQSKIMNAGAKRVVLSSPQFDVIGETEIASCTGINITYGGIEDD
ncbi:MAG: baseplate J/gp47 family protein [Clostridium sp.]|nr:baseplate J/gp47 family protein [Clostridium sp.]